VLDEPATGRPPIVATRHTHQLRLHRCGYGGLAEIRAAQLPLQPKDETRELMAAAGIKRCRLGRADTLPPADEGLAPGCGWTHSPLQGHPEPKRFVRRSLGSDRTVASIDGRDARTGSHRGEAPAMRHP